jgi:hypothetical protein
MENMPTPTKAAAVIVFRNVTMSYPPLASVKSLTNL